MAGQITALVPKALALFAIVLGIFGGMSYGFYQFGASWYGLGFLVGLIGVFALLLSFLRDFFGKFNGRITFALFLIAVLGSYFVFLFNQDKYPMGIDLAGGSELIYSLDYSQTDRNIAEIEKKIREEKDETKLASYKMQLDTLVMSKKTAPDKAAEVLRKRVDPTGTKGIPVTTLGRDKERLRIQLPKATPQEVERIKNAIKTQGRLAFHIAQDNQEIIEKTKEYAKKNKTTISENGLYEVKVIKTPNKFTSKMEEETIVINRFPDMEGSRVTLAQARPSHEGTGWEIGVRFDPAGGVEFGTLTQNNKGKRMAIVLDGEVYSAPTIKDAIYGECVISGNFDEVDSERLAGVLTAGSLPAEVSLISEFTVGPSLGREQVDSGMRATIIGTGVVILFMLVYYRLAGAIAAFCMLLNLPMLIGAMGFFKATLTLPGIAGIVLTLGMAVDANVLIIERLREELARGRSMKLAVSHGFNRAFLTIIDCHLTTLISAVVLYYLGTGPVRGFAVSLSLGILTTLFCNLWLNWLIMDWMVSREALPSLTLMQFFKETNIDFMGSRRLWMAITGSLAFASLALFLTFTTTSDRLYDVDFTGGTLIQFNFAHGKAKEDAEVKKVVESTVKTSLSKDVEDVLGKLKQVAAANKTGTELQKAITNAVPIAEGVGKNDTSPEGLQELIKRLEESQKKIKETDMVTQGYDRPENGTTKFRSFTITTRLVEPIVIDELYNELLKTFKAELEPPAMVPDEKTILVRFNKTDKVTVDNIKAQLTDASKELSNEDVRPALLEMKVDDLKADETFPGYMTAKIGPIPTDPVQKSKISGVLELLKDRAWGPVSRKSGFGAAVAGEMKFQAFLALAVANLGVFIYLWFRFEFSGAWGFGAIVALIHDVVIAAGAVVVANLLGFPILFNLNIVAALLTIVGYSVSDTIVVFDRIREVKAAHPTRSYEEIVNEAVNATLSRTILTSLTVLLASGSLLLFGGPTIADMAYTLFVGFTVGTYSSIFIAAPLMIWWYRSFGSGKGPGIAPVAPAKAAKSENALGAQI